MRLIAAQSSQLQEIVLAPGHAEQKCVCMWERIAPQAMLAIAAAVHWAALSGSTFRN